MKDEKRTIYITNFWFAVNYGANLTAYAIYKLFSKFNNNTYILDNLQYKDKLLYEKYYVKKFAQKYLKIKKYENEENAIVITGSDQVFNPECEPKYNDFKFLEFVNSNNKKLAFSASFGVYKEQFLKENSVQIIERMKTSLKSFDLISVRENSGIEICKDLFDIDAKWIIDPVFIIDKKEYEFLEKNSKINSQDKIVTYILSRNNEHNKAIKYLQKKYNTTSINLDDFKYSPENWLLAIKNCKLFITDSFHGMCFAIIYNKPFICLKSKVRGSARIDSLCNMLNIEKQYINSISEIYEKDCIFKIDYDRVNKRINEERQKGLEFIKKIFEIPVNNIEEKKDIRIEYLENKVKELEKQNSMNYQIKKSSFQLCQLIYHKYLPKLFQKIIGICYDNIIGICKNAYKK